MQLSNIKNSIVSIFLILGLVLEAQQALAYEVAIDRPILKAAPSTLQCHDDLEIQKAFCKESAISVRKRVKKF